MNDDFYSVFAKEWDLQTGSLMLKDKNSGIEWKKTIALHFFFKAVEKSSLFYAKIVERNAKLEKENKTLKEEIETLSLEFDEYRNNQQK